MFFLIIFQLITSGYCSTYSDFVDAIYYEKIGEYSKSFDIVEKINKKENNEYLYRYMYELAVKGQMNNKAKEVLEKLIEIDSTSSSNWYSYANYLAMEGDLEKAKEKYLKAIELDGENIDAYYQLAIISKDIDESIKYFNKIIEIDPSFKSDVYYNIAVLYSMKKDEKKMVEYLNKAIEENPYALRPYYFLATYYDEKGNFTKVVELYKKMFEIESTNSELTNRIAEIYLSTKDYKTAEAYFIKTLKIDPLNKKALWWLALLSEEKKDYKQAIKYLSSIKGWDNEVDLVLKMSYYNIMDSNMERAMEILKDAQKKWPNNYEISYYLGLGYMDLKDDKKAKEVFEIFISSVPDNYEVRFNLGVICERLNDVECFKKHFGYIIEKKPDDANALNYLGYSLVDRDIEIDKAFDMIKRAVEIDGENPAYLDSLAWAYYKKGDFENAFNYIEKSLDIMTKKNMVDDPLIYEHKADILVKLNRYFDAYLSYYNAIICGAKNVEVINKKVKDIVPMLDKYDIFYNYFSNNTKNNFTMFFNLEFNYRYKKFLKTKNIKFTLSGFNKLIPEKKYIASTVLGPLYTPVVSAEMLKDRYTFRNDISDERVDSQIFEKYYIRALSVLNWYFNSSFYLDYKKENKGRIISQDNCYLYDNVFSQGDIIKLCSNKNMFAPDFISYQSDISFNISLNDYKVMTDSIYPTFKYYMPFSIIFDFKNFTVNITVDKFDFNEK